MAHLSRQFPLKPQSLLRLFSGVFSFDNRLKGADIEDDWEYIEVFDEEVAGCRKGESSGEDNISECGDDSFFPFLSLNLPTPEIKYTILSKAEVLQCIEEKITRVTTVLLLPRSEAAAILHHFKWSVMWTEEEWLTSEKKVRKAVGLYDQPIIMTPVAAERCCWTCHEKFLVEMMLGVSCGHQLCRSCWTGYISKAISNGPGCLGLRCPVPSCDASVGLDLIELLSSEEDKKNFEHYLIRSCLTDCREAKWCPAPDCECAVLLNAGGDDSSVTCRCSYRFCWNCTKETHAPVDCGTVDKWMSETNVQSENWMLVHTKPCPMCGSPIQKNKGCKYLECTLCNYEFCCTCGGKWPAIVTGDECYYNCPHDESPRRVEYHEEGKYERDIAETHLEKYSHFYEGWIINDSSRENALTDLKLLQGIQLEMMFDSLGLSEKDLNFLVDAQLQIAECYQILKWTYVYGYFLSEDENAKKCFLEFMQEQAMDLVRKLENQVSGLEVFLNLDASLKHFMDFRQRLLLLTRAVKNHFDRMVGALKTGLPEVVSIPNPKPESL